MSCRKPSRCWYDESSIVECVALPAVLHQTLLQETNVDNCRRNLETNKTDMDMVKDCITTTEVRRFGGVWADISPI